MGPQAKECRQPVEAGKKLIFFNLDLPKGMPTLWFKLRLILDFWLLEL